MREVCTHTAQIYRRATKKLISQSTSWSGFLVKDGITQNDTMTCVMEIDFDDDLDRDLFMFAFAGRGKFITAAEAPYRTRLP